MAETEYMVLRTREERLAFARKHEFVQHTIYAAGL